MCVCACKSEQKRLVSISAYIICSIKVVSKAKHSLHRHEGSSSAVRVQVPSLGARFILNGARNFTSSLQTHRVKMLMYLRVWAESEADRQREMQETLARPRGVTHTVVEV